MCGIAGVLYFNGKKAEESTLRSMTKAMGHRGPDAEGVLRKIKLDSDIVVYPLSIPQQALINPLPIAPEIFTWFTTAKSTITKK